MGGPRTAENHTVSHRDSIGIGHRAVTIPLREQRPGGEPLPDPLDTVDWAMDGVVGDNHSVNDQKRSRAFTENPQHLLNQARRVSVMRCDDTPEIKLIFCFIRVIFGHVLLNI